MLKKQYNAHEWTSGSHEFYSKATQSICRDLVILSGQLKNEKLTLENREQTRLKKLQREIELIHEHQKKCRDYETLRRMNKTIAYLKQLKSEPDACYR